MINLSRLLCGCAGAALVLTAISAATAQDASTSAPPADPQSAKAGNGTSADIVVTARRRAENLEKVPVSVSALGAAQLKSQSINSQADLQRAVPGLIIRQSQNQNDITYSIRGQTIDAFSGSFPAVLAYVNEIQLNTASASSFYDLGSIQVLKGPQGTLFGRNVTGGAVLYTTARPTEEAGGFVTGRVGNFDMREVQAAVNIPVVSDSVLFRVAGDLQHQNGYVLNLANGVHLGASRHQSVRGTLLLKPAAGFQNITTVQYEHSGGNNVGNVAYSAYACGATNNGIALATPADCLYSPKLDATVGRPGAWDAYLAAHPGAYPGGILAYVDLQKKLGPWKVYQYGPSYHRGFSWYVANTSTYDLSEAVQIKNIFGVSRGYTNDMEDLFGAPYGFELQQTPSGHGYRYDTKQLSNEFQILGKAFDHKLTYILGAYYATENKTTDLSVATFDVSPILSPGYIKDYFRVKDETEALFFQGTLDTSSFTGIDGLSITGGFRYTWDKNQVFHLPGDRYAGYASEQEKVSKPSWQVGLEYQVNQRLLLYVEHRGSWRAGGFNGTAPPVALPGTRGGNEYLPETTHDVEVGAKFNGRLGTMPFRLNVAVYNQWIHNVQRSLYANVPFNGVTELAGLTVNIPEAEVRGVEADVDLRLSDLLRIGGNVAFTDARFTKNEAVLFETPQAFGPYADAPKWAGSVFGEVTLPVSPDLGQVRLRGDLYLQTGQYFSNQNDYVTPQTRLPGYPLVSLRLDWDNVAHTPVSISAFAKNPLNKRYFVGGVSQAAAFGESGASPGQPRMYGAEVTFKF